MKTTLNTEEFNKKISLISQVYSTVKANQLKLRVFMTAFSLAICLLSFGQIEQSIGKDQIALKSLKGGLANYVIGRSDSLMLNYFEPFGQVIYIFKKNICTGIEIRVNYLSKAPALPEYAIINTCKNDYQIILH